VIVGLASAEWEERRAPPLSRRGSEALLAKLGDD